MNVTAYISRPHGMRPLSARTTTSVVTRRIHLAHAVLFDTDSAVLRPGEASYLQGLRHHLTGIRTLTCTGSTDFRAGTGYNMELARRRAAGVCAVLARGLAADVTVRSTGEASPKASNATSAGRQLNREVTLTY